MSIGNTEYPQTIIFMIDCYPMETFAAWLNRQLIDRRLEPKEFARLSNMPLPTLWRILNEQRGVGKRSAQKIARGLNLPERLVMFKAGIVSSDAEMPAITPDEYELLIDYRLLSDGEQRTARTLLRTLRENSPDYGDNKRRQLP